MSRSRPGQRTQRGGDFSRPAAEGIAAPGAAGPPYCAPEANGAVGAPEIGRGPAPRRPRARDSEPCCAEPVRSVALAGWSGGGVGCPPPNPSPGRRRHSPPAPQAWLRPYRRLAGPVTRDKLATVAPRPSGTHPSLPSLTRPGFARPASAALPGGRNEQRRGYADRGEGAVRRPAHI